jgi:hypothetical protein
MQVVAEHAAAREDAPAFDMLDALGIARLVKRTPTLDGTVPVRVAQACAPLLEGNAFGWQIVLEKPLIVRSAWGRGSARFEDGEGVARRVDAAVPRLTAQGFLASGGAWAGALRHAARIERGVVRVWTGLLVRPARGVWLRLSSAANRRDRRFSVRETFFADANALTPVVLDLDIEVPGEVRLSGEIACVAPLAPGLAFERTPLRVAKEIGRAHVAFYDAAYFAKKRDDVTRKYRRLISARDAHERELDPAAPTSARLVDTGSAPIDLASVDRFLGPRSTLASASSPDGARLAHAIVKNIVPFRARFDGHTLAVDADEHALAAAARAIESTWRAAFGDAFLRKHKGALLYLTKYFTPHPPGEPHFFVKPPAFIQTPTGWSTLLEPIHGDGYDILRGVVRTDRFFATPAVFALHGSDRAIHVPAGAPLLRLLPVRRDLLEAPWRALAWADERARA